MCDLEVALARTALTYPVSSSAPLRGVLDHPPPPPLSCRLIRHLSISCDCVASLVLSVVCCVNSLLIAVRLACGPYVAMICDHGDSLVCLVLQ